MPFSSLDGSVCIQLAGLKQLRFVPVVHSHHPILYFTVIAVVVVISTYFRGL